MIRRAQAEALLKLAEALEECERNGVTLEAEYELINVYADNEWLIKESMESELTPMSVRVAIAKLYPKSEAAE